MAPQTLKKKASKKAAPAAAKKIRIDVEAITGMTTEERRREIFGPTGKPRTPHLSAKEWNDLLDPEADFGEGDEFERWLDEIRGRTKSDGESERQ